MGTYTISAYSGSATSLSLYTTLDGIRVNRIGSSAFQSNSILTQIKGDSILSIESNAFKSCYALTTASFPRCSYIGGSCFYSCSSLSSISFPNCSYIGGNAFRGCPALTSANFPKCEYINYGAFEQCLSLSEVYLSKCNSIQSGAFCGAGVQSFQQSWFNSSYYKIISGALFLSDETTLHTFPPAFSSNVILSECFKVGQSAFAYANATTISLPNCTYIDSQAMAYCQTLSSVDAPLCTYISREAFWYCPSLTSVNFPNCSYIGSYAFYSCFSLASISFPNCTYIATDAFNYTSFQSNQISSSGYAEYTNSYNSYLLKVDSTSGFTSFSGNHTFICGNVFGYCNSLTSVSFPNCSYIGQSVFYNCSSLSTICLMSTSMCSLYSRNGSLVFSGTGITSSTGSIYVPMDLVSAYQSASGWSYFSTQIIGRYAWDTNPMTSAEITAAGYTTELHS